jgi:hypothetical protein
MNGRSLQSGTIAIKVVGGKLTPARLGRQIL